jgi:MFS family permease
MQSVSPPLFLGEGLGVGAFPYTSEGIERMQEFERATEARSRRGQIVLYFGILTMALGLGRPDIGLAQLPVQFFLKDRLHLSPTQQATFGLLANIPFYAGFLFGFMRDRYRPLGWGDRGYLLLATPFGVACYCWLAQSPVTYARLLGAVLLVSLVFQWLLAATQGLLATVGQQQLMTGRLGAMWMFALTAPGVVAGFGGGWLAKHVSMQATFWLVAAITLILFFQAFWRPAAIFTAEQESHNLMDEGGLQAIRRLFQHRPYWLAAGVMLCWNFVPGWFTPLLFHMTKTVGMSSETYGLFQAIMAAGNGVAIIFYGFLCRRMSLHPLLWIGTLFGIIPSVMMFLIHNPTQGIILAFIAGPLNGIANAGYMDLLLRSCPRKLEGTGTTLVYSVNLLAVYVSDVFGAWLYQRGGYVLAFSVSALTTATVFLFIPFLPKRLIAYRDGEMSEEMEEKLGEAALVTGEYHR